MLRFQNITAIVFLAFAAACTTITTDFGTPVPSTMTANWRLSDVRVTVPDTLTVSDVNMLAPDADIVWHEDLAGDRRLQVATILDDAITRGASGLSGGRAVVLDVTLVRFHALSPYARQLTGGVHKISFSVVVRDALTGAQLLEPVVIQADEDAYGSGQAKEAEANGLTQKIRISNRISLVVASWLGVTENSVVNSNSASVGL